MVDPNELRRVGNVLAEAKDRIAELEAENRRLKVAIQFVAMLTDQDGGAMNGLGFKFFEDGTFRCTAMVDGPGPDEGCGATEWEALLEAVAKFWDLDRASYAWKDRD